MTYDRIPEMADQYFGALDEAFLAQDGGPAMDTNDAIIGTAHLDEEEAREFEDWIRECQIADAEEDARRDAEDEARQAIEDEWREARDEMERERIAARLLQSVDLDELTDPDDVPFN